MARLYVCHVFITGQRPPRRPPPRLYSLTYILQTIFVSFFCSALLMYKEKLTAYCRAVISPFFSSSAQMVFTRVGVHATCHEHMCVTRVSSLTHWQLIVAEHPVAVVVLEQRSEHLGAHLRLPPQGHVGGHHFVVGVQVVAGMGRQMREEGISTPRL